MYVPIPKKDIYTHKGALKTYRNLLHLHKRAMYTLRSPEYI